MAIQAAIKETTFGVGDVVRVHQIIADKSESEKGSRTQAFEGTVIGIKGHGIGKSFTVRRIGEQKIGIEMIFPVSSPVIERVEVVREGKRGTRHAKLYYTRAKSTREIEKIYTRSKRKGIKTEAKPKAKKVSSGKKNVPPRLVKEYKKDPAWKTSLKKDKK